jgi:hypothetical protein
MSQTDAKKGLTLKGETFAELADDKPDGVTWDYYLLDLKERANE